MEQIDRLLEFVRVQLFGIWIVATIFIAIPAMLAAQVWGFIYILRKRDWLRALVLATPLGHLYLLLIAVRQEFTRWGFGFRIRREEPGHLKLFKLAYNLAGTVSLVVIVLVLLIRALEWALGQ